jgi:topoisomerase IV subunit B
MSDLFTQTKKQKKDNSYTADDIEILEGLEPVRKRPGMYIGGTDLNALHHLVSEILDNSMDESVAGYASEISLHLNTESYITISDNGRGIPIDPHPKYPDKSALEVIFTTLHSGGKFNNNVYQTSGGLHGVGVSVVNALSDSLTVEVERSGAIWQQSFSRGIQTTTLQKIGKSKKTGTKVTFHPDTEIFEDITFSPERLYNLIKSKAYLFKGVTIKWSCSPELIENSNIPSEEIIHFPNGIIDYINSIMLPADSFTDEMFCGNAQLSNTGKIEWALNWSETKEGFCRSYCNTIYNPQGGTHETGFKNAVTKSIKQFAEMSGYKKSNQITTDDIFSDAFLMLSVFIPNPHFLGQTKEKLLTPETAKQVEAAVKDIMDHWLTANKERAALLLEFFINKADERLNRRKDKETQRKTATNRIRLPGKLSDCATNNVKISELFLVEGDSAGGSAKQARYRDFQAILPLRGKILNVVSNSIDKIKANQELNDIVTALGCGSGKNYRHDNLRYNKIIIMTDADVDGAHIASLLMAYFYQEMPQLVTKGHLYLAKPPLYRITHSNKTYYANNDAEREKLIKKLGRGKIEVGRFKGLGEMTAPQLKETTMDPKSRSLYKVILGDNDEIAANQVEILMGKKPELRFKFIQERTFNIDSAELEKLIDI